MNQGTRTDRLDASKLFAAAEAATGLSDWGPDPTFKVGIDKLIQAVEAMDAAPLLRRPLGAEITQRLATRLRLQDDANRHPEILAGRIERPLILTGSPRSGTTWLYELLALDPAVRAPLNWEVSSPWPAPEAATYETDERIGQAQAAFAAMLAAQPELGTMHNFDARLPEECNAFTTFHFASSNFWASYGVPEYIRWLTHDQPPGVFITHKRILQQLQWKGPRGRWLLKSPPHLLMLDQLIEAYPDAMIIQTHREPATMVASLSSFIRAIRKGRFADVPELMEPKALARSVMGHFGEALERAAKTRQDPAIDRHFIDIGYRETLADPVGVVRRIYERFDLPFTADYEARLHELVNAPRSSGHGKHIYDPKEFGVSELDLPHQFPTYRARFADLLSDR